MCSNKGDKVVLGECLRLSVLLKMNAVQFTLDRFEFFFFFQKYLHIERSSNFHGIYLICYTSLLWKPIKPYIFMKLTVLGSDLSYYKG